MDRIINLDHAADEISRRRGVWQAEGLDVGPVTWRDEAAKWPRQLEMDRANVADPDSVGVKISGPGAELEVVLFRGGWTHVDTLTREGVDTETHEILLAAAFGPILEHCASRAISAGSVRPN